jgi:hypothetical protein
MVVAANMAFAHVKGVARDPKDYEVYKSSLYTDKDEERMDIIGQNGNNGEHYEGVTIEEQTKHTNWEDEKEEVFKESESIIPEMNELEELRKLVNHPRVKDAIKHAKRAGEWN